MLLSQTAEYALRAMAWIAIVPEGQAIRARDLSVHTEIPSHYLSKILRRLVLAGLLLSRKGHGGGFTLAKPAKDVRFIDVLQAVDAAPAEGHCAFGWGTCSAEHPCPLHPSWDKISTAFREWAETTTMADIDPVDPEAHLIRTQQA